MPPRRSVAPSDTPARVTRARSKTPLPAIGGGQSHAYGAPGKAHLGSQMRESEETFSQQFEETRASVSAVAPPPTTARRSGGTVDARDRDRASPAAAAPPPPPPPPPPPAAAAVLPEPQTVLDGRAAYNGPMAALWAEICKLQIHFAAYFGFLFGFFLVFTFLIYALAPSSNAGGLTRVMLGYPPYDRPMDSLETAWLVFRAKNYSIERLNVTEFPQMQWLLNTHFADRFDRLEARVAKVETALQLTSETLEETQRMLPTHVLLDFVDGQPTIPADFWTAFQARVAENTEMAPAWQAWITGNDNQLSTLLEDYSRGIIDDRIKNGQIIQRDEFVKALDDQNNFLMAKYKDEVLEFTKQQSVVIKDLVQSKFDAAAKKNPTQDQLRALLHVHTLHNSYRTTHFINWFSPGLGARINPHLTSVTKGLQSRGWLSDIYLKVHPLDPKPMPPIAALVKWEEPTDCWCGTPSDKGYVQIGVITPLKFHPTYLIVEHIPQSATLDGNSAPHKIVAWINLESKEEAKRVRDLYADRYWLPDADFCGKSPPGPNWFCALTGEYSTHGNHVQEFQFRIDAVKDNIAVNRVVVRAVTNHGGGYTCFYRLRAEG